MAVKLDTIDQKLLAVLMKNARISTTELAKVIKHNYPTVRNRLNKLIENNVIRHFYPIVQLPGIGARRYMGVYLTLKNITSEEQKSLFKKLCKHSFLIEVFELQGKWNVALLLVCNYVREANETLGFIQEVTKDYLTDLIVMPTYTISNLNKKFFTDLEVKGEIKTGYRNIINDTSLVHLSGKLKLSKEDVKLLDYIKLNARDSLEVIGEEIGMDATSVDYKLKKMINIRFISC